MTVIAYANGVMACDSLWTDGPYVKSTVLTKIEKLPNGILYGCSGDNDDRALKSLVKKLPSNKKITEADLPSLEKLVEILQDLTAILVTPFGDIFIVTTARDPYDNESDYGVGAYRITREYYAIGAGGEMAIGYMGSGKSAAEAVEFTCDWNISCAGPVHVVQFEE